ncbi:hypothetical protein [Brevundimonas halotolerans]|uniref:Uncharacterized protein n=1 Tax=Brevundimonas halotolerans TaxID=69670 RepID=A0A7W9E6J5_9CAUL|nr:hypothetical protein [Brevundimonas halotolerans]MBB5660008.1 hypothetical protein [Brevundimonas halotolerans]
MRPDPSTSLSRPGRLLGAAAALGLTVVAMPAVAQDAPALRYLDWNGRPEPVAMARATPSARGDVPALRPAAPVIPHAGSQSMAAVPQLRPATPLLPGRSVDADGRPGLTPADAFFAPPPVQSRSQPAPAPARTVAAPVEAPTPVRQMPEPPPARAQPAPQPAPAPAPVAYSAPAPAPARPAEWADDPNAPRSDALIWSVGQPQPPSRQPQATQPQPTQPQPAPTQAQTRAPAPAQARTEPSPQGARYYSVHRQNGRQPDRAVLPEQVYLDALPVQMDQTPTSPNMAEPPGPPQLVRNPDGTVRRTTGESTSSAASRQ